MVALAPSPSEGERDNQGDARAAGGRRAALPGPWQEATPGTRGSRAGRGRRGYRETPSSWEVGSTPLR